MRFYLPRLGGLRIVPGNRMVREQAQRLDVLAREKILKCPDTNVTGGHAGEHPARKRSFLAHHSLAGGHGGE